MAESGIEPEPRFWATTYKAYRYIFHSRQQPFSQLHHSPHLPIEYVQFLGPMKLLGAKKNGLLLYLLN